MRQKKKIFFLNQINFYLFFFHEAFESRCPYRVIQSLIHFAVWTFLFYFFCNLGEEVGSRFTGISDAIYDCPWHEMPTKLRKCLQIMMCISQKPITLQGNNKLCNRKQFTKVRLFYFRTDFRFTKKSHFWSFYICFKNVIFSIQYIIYWKMWILSVSDNLHSVRIFHIIQSFKALQTIIGVK